ncbi:hypothetical protein [Alsobacter sp. R-9]
MVHRLIALARTTVLLAAVATVAGPTGVQAQKRPDTLTMTCAQAAALVRQQGAIVLGTGQYVFDRFVADGRFCSINEVAAPTRVQTKDQKACMLLSKCTPKRDYWEDNFFWR